QRGDDPHRLDWPRVLRSSGGFAVGAVAASANHGVDAARVAGAGDGQDEEREDYDRVEVLRGPEVVRQAEQIDPQRGGDDGTDAGPQAERARRQRYLPDHLKGE